MFPRALKNRDDAFWAMEKAVDALGLLLGSPLSQEMDRRLAIRAEAPRVRFFPAIIEEVVDP
jgi:hypothetical protein